MDLIHSDHWVLGYLSDQLALHPRLLSLAGLPDLGRLLVVPNFFHLRMMEATVILGTFNAVDIFQICALTQSCLAGLFSEPHGYIINCDTL